MYKCASSHTQTCDSSLLYRERFVILDVSTRGLRAEGDEFLHSCCWRVLLICKSKGCDLHFTYRICRGGTPMVCSKHQVEQRSASTTRDATSKIVFLRGKRHSVRSHWLCPRGLIFSHDLRQRAAMARPAHLHYRCEDSGTVSTTCCDYNARVLAHKSVDPLRRRRTT